MLRGQSRLHNKASTFRVVLPLPTTSPVASMCASYPPALNPAGRQAHPTQHAGGTGLQNYTIDRGNYVEVAGARHYKLEIQRALGEKAKVSFNDEVECLLIPEVDNPYDPNAIAIKV